MYSKKCPDCGSYRFYFKDPEDQYTLLEFEIKEGDICYDEPEEVEQFEVTEQTETYCDRCAWHDKLGVLK